ncbi:hypothetical protein FJ366_03390 [Candidatus Dependentiae bacterium]|nr:hypothetical protein [Candidatus Dependentiae bacterium]
MVLKKFLVASAIAATTLSFAPRNEEYYEIERLVQEHAYQVGNRTICPNFTSDKVPDNAVYNQVVRILGIVYYATEKCHAYNYAQGLRVDGGIEQIPVPVYPEYAGKQDDITTQIITTYLQKLADAPVIWFPYSILKPTFNIGKFIVGLADFKRVLTTDFESLNAIALDLKAHYDEVKAAHARRAATESPDDLAESGSCVIS